MTKKRPTSVVGVLLTLMIALLMLGACFEIKSAASKEENVNPVQGLVINEVMADNDAAVAGPERTYPDWIELYNGSNETIKLGGMYLTNDLADPKGWKFPKNTIISSGDYLVIWMDNKNGYRELHASFALGANVEAIGLFADDGKTLIDAVVLDKQLRDVSYGRIPDGGSEWQYLTVPTPNEANQANVSARTLTSVYAVVAVVAVIGIVIVSVVIASKLVLKRDQL